ncbi:hypothetical protein ACSQ67_024908 [Phaseolus vulgaris]
MMAPKSSLVVGSVGADIVIGLGRGGELRNPNFDIANHNRPHNMLESDVTRLQDMEADSLCGDTEKLLGRVNPLVSLANMKTDKYVVKLMRRIGELQDEGRARIYFIWIRVNTGKGERGKALMHMKFVIDSLQKIISVEDVEWHHRKVSKSVLSEVFLNGYTNMKFEDFYILNKFLLLPRSRHLKPSKLAALSSPKCSDQ